MIPATLTADRVYTIDPPAAPAAGTLHFVARVRGNSGQALPFAAEINNGDVTVADGLRVLFAAGQESGVLLVHDDCRGDGVKWHPLLLLGGASLGPL